MADSSHTNPLRILVIGSTGSLGRAVLRNADSGGVKVRAFARHPEALVDEAGFCVNFEVVRGDVRDVDSLVRALDGVDAVISALGSKPWRRDARGVFEAGTANLIEAMGRTGVERAVVVTGVGAGDSRGHGPFWYNWLVQPTILRSTYADKERQEALLAESGLDWTIVRPAVLSDKGVGRPVRTSVKLGRRQKLGAISRDDVARFLLAETLTPKYVHQIVHLHT
ncbi:MAG: NAD(P)H-binding protein [Ancrocorticia sp.]